MKELAFQTEILKSARLQGGFGQKIAHRFKVGVPDLLVSMPGHGMVLLECKALNEVGDKFKRATGVSVIQQETMLKYNSTQQCPVAAQLVYLVHHGVPRAVVWPADATVISWEYEKGDGIWVERSKRGPHWDVTKLVAAVKLMKSSKKEEPPTEIS